MHLDNIFYVFTYRVTLTTGALLCNHMVGFRSWNGVGRTSEWCRCVDVVLCLVVSQWWRVPAVGRVNAVEGEEMGQAGDRAPHLPLVDRCGITPLSTRSQEPLTASHDKTFSAFLRLLCCVDGFVQVSLQDRRISLCLLHTMSHGTGLIG